MRKIIKLLVEVKYTFVPSFTNGKEKCSCFILHFILPPKRSGPSLAPKTPSLKGWATSSPGSSKWCLNLIRWNVPEPSDSKMLRGRGPKKSLPPACSPGCDPGETPAGEVWNCTQHRRRSRTLSAENFSGHPTESTSAQPFLLFHHCLPTATSASGDNALSMGKRQAGQPPSWEGRRSISPPRPQLNSPKHPLEGGEGEREEEDTWSPGHLARDPTADR